jgi:hypothetical protein
MMGPHEDTTHLAIVLQKPFLAANDALVNMSCHAAPKCKRGRFTPSQGEVSVPLAVDPHGVTTRSGDAAFSRSADILESLQRLLHGVACRVGVEEQPMYGVDAPKLLHGLVRIEHGAVSGIESMALDRAPP